MLLGPIRRLLRQCGYVLWKREYLRFGVDTFLDVRRLARKWERPVNVIFDVGANIGQTIRAAREEFPDARIFSFEPEPSTFRHLSTIVKDANASLHQLALGEKDGEAILHVYGEAGHGASLRNSLVPDARSAVQFGFKASDQKVKCQTLDSFCRDNGVDRIDLLKIDVEGFELSVCRGAERMLREGRIGFIYMEFNDLQPIAGATGGALLPLDEFLRPFGFRYVAAYTDFVDSNGAFFVVANALFACPPADS